MTIRDQLRGAAAKVASGEIGGVETDYDGDIGVQLTAYDKRPKKPSWLAFMPGVMIESVKDQPGDVATAVFARLIDGIPDDVLDRNAD